MGVFRNQIARGFQGNQRQRSVEKIRPQELFWVSEVVYSLGSDGPGARAKREGTALRKPIAPMGDLKSSFP